MNDNTLNTSNNDIDIGDVTDLHEFTNDDIADTNNINNNINNNTC